MAKKNKKKKSKKRTPLGYQLKMAMTDRYQAHGNYNPQVQHLVSRERPNLREIRMGLPLSRGLQGSEANPSICGCLPNKMTGGQKCDEDG